MAVGIPESEITPAKIPESEIIIKARNDQREYRRIVLPNSLQVLLISDPDTDKAAASMSVGVGSFSNPDGLEGLAHFLEHMLFYASEKYPLENSYKKYITEHGGSTNAFTAHDQTNYHFDVNASSFDEALDRFAQFFINPLMSADATSREIKAVDSENKKNLLSDALRMLQLQKHLSAESHPFHGFSTGNCATLEVRPKERGVDIREELLKFYDKNYSANLMHLVVYSEKSLDELQSLVGGTFQAIRNTEKNRYLCPGQPCMHEHLQILVKTVPVRQRHKLTVVWPITPSICHYKGAPCRYLSRLIGHEGEGSLFYIFKSLGWVTSLSAGESDWTYEFSFFNISIALTDLGHDHVEDIVGLLFKYILLLRNSGVQKWVFDELSAIAETLFHFKDKTRALNYVCNIASNMQKYPLKDWLVASSLPSEYSPELIQATLDELTPDNVRIFWASHAFKTETDQVEPWYGTEYSIRKLSTSIIQEWIQKSPDEKIHFPAPNVFIPTDLSIKDVPNKAKSPVLLRKSAYSRLWYKPDTMFSSPKAYVKIRFICPYTNHSPEAEVLTEIFTRLLMDYLNDYAYDAQVAGLYYGIAHSDTGFQVTVVGYNHKMRILVDTVLEKIADFKVKPDRFYVIKETVIKKYRNFKFQQPYQQAMNYCSLILENHSWPWTEKLEILPHLEADDLMKFSPLLLSKSFLNCYVAGNIEPTEAEAMIFHVEDIFFKGPKPLCRALLPSEHLANRVVKLGRGTSHIYQSEVLNKDEQNSAFLHYIQVHQDNFMMNVKLQLFALIAKQPTFHQLRSVEQLGYITTLMQRNNMGVRGLQFIIQSSVKDPGHIETRVEAFLREFESKLYELSNDEFKSNVNSLIDVKLEKFKNLREESAFYWKEITKGTLKFDRKEAEVAALKTLSKSDLTNFFDEYIKVGAPNKRTLSVQVYGNLHSNEYNAAQNEQLNGKSTRIEDIFSFRRSQSLYGSFTGGIAQMKL